MADPMRELPNGVLKELRSQFMRDGLCVNQLVADPIQQFRIWYDLVLSLPIFMPDAMTLATATRDGQPSARMVLLKGYDERGFVFFTNYLSRKGQELAHNSRAALILFWKEIERQVRIEGAVELTTAEESDQYHHSRPRGSRISAAVSQQSAVVADRTDLERRYAEMESALADQPVPRPPYWGGYRVIPACIEFWQGRDNRLHDRFSYSRNPNGAWRIERLAP